jgi:hypothetical protein
MKVAVRFNILRGDFGGIMMNWQPPLPCRAEGVYEPWTGEMHLVANVQLAKEDDAGDNGKTNNYIEPMVHQPGSPQVYVKIQYAPMNSTTGAAHPLHFHMESLRSLSDPLFFPPLQFQGPQFLIPPKVASSTSAVTAGDPRWKYNGGGGGKILKIENSSSEAQETT